jgi:hypothetical protein
MDRHRQGAGGPRSAPVGLPQRQERTLLPELRANRRGRRLRPLVHLRGASCAGGLRRPLMGQSAQAGAGTVQRPIRRGLSTEEFITDLTESVETEDHMNPV